MSESMAPLQKLDDFRWLVPQSYMTGMRVPGLIYASRPMIEHIVRDKVLVQVANVACLPGIVGKSLAMPDAHWGYGFPIGGVAATSMGDGVVSPGGVGFDINCGVRLLRTNLQIEEASSKLPELVDELYNTIPSGLGSTGNIRLPEREMARVLEEGAGWAVREGYGRPEDLETTEEQGAIAGADEGSVSRRARERGTSQLGTLGSGNHFLEVAVVDRIWDEAAAHIMGIDRKGQIMLWIHTGSRGLGHQVADDHIKLMLSAMDKYRLSVPDRQLACAPVNSPEAQTYFMAMKAAANYAWANRQLITHWARQSFARVFAKNEILIGLELVYDVAHNMAKIENHTLGTKVQKLCVHRKGATRAFPAGHRDLPAKYKNTGQPVLIPGDMGRYSYIMTGTEKAMSETFGSTCHGAGRLKSRMAAKKMISGRDFIEELAARGILVRAGSLKGVSEEASAAYKDIVEVIDVAEKSGISSPVARTRPIGVIKG